MMYDDLVARLRELLAKATPGPWEVDTIENDGAYGSGPDAVHGFKSPVMLDAEGKALFDAYNSDLIEVHEEYDEDSCHAWDEQGRANFALVAAAVNALPDLLATIESLRAELAEANLTLVAFAAPTMVQYAKDCGLPKNSLHPNHYDILAKAGARMDSFTRAEIERTTT